jgi:hypothetical protein
MEELLKSSDFLKIVGLLGGFTVLVQTVIGAVWAFFQNRMLARWAAKASADRNIARKD